MLLPLRSSSRASEKLSSQPELSWHTTGTTVANGEEWSGIECARTLYRRRSTVAWITCLGILATTIISMVQPRLYQSQASLEIQQVNENFLNFRDIYPTAASGADASGVYLQTQAEILQKSPESSVWRTVGNTVASASGTSAIVPRVRLPPRPRQQGTPSSY